MKEELRKSLTDLIDETLLELEELRKSRFEAAEIDLKGPGEGLAGKPSNGDLHAKKAEDEEEDEEEEKEEAKKAEGQNRQADPDGGHHKMDKAEGQNRQADPDGGHHKMDKKEEDDPADHPDTKRKVKDLLGKKEDEDKEDKDEPHKDDPKHEEKEKKLARKLLDMHKEEVKKSLSDSESLLKSFVDERVKPLEEKLSSIFELVNKIAGQPVPPKGTTANAIPLRKSNEEGVETLSKSDIASKLFELKKSGTKVDSLDITRAEMGQDLQKIVDKYKIS